MGWELRTLVALAMSASVLCGTALAQGRAPAVMDIGSETNWFWVPSGKDISACISKSRDKRVTCNYPSLTPCTDKDGDGWYKCDANESVRAYDQYSVKGTTPLPDGGLSMDFSLAGPNQVLGSNYFPDWVVLGGPCFFNPDHTRCQLWQWGDVGFIGDNQDCDDNLSTVGSNDAPGNSAPIERIVSVYRDPQYVKEALQQRQVVLRRSLFNPFDSLIVDIKTNRCVSELEAEVKLTVAGTPLTLGTALFRQKESGEKGVLSGKLSNLFDLSVSNSLVELNRPAKIRPILEAMAGRLWVTAWLSLTTKHGTVSIPITLYPCVPLYGDGDIRISVGRPKSLETGGKTLSGEQVKPLLSPKNNNVRPIQFGYAIKNALSSVDFLKEQLGRFSIVADLSLLQEKSDGEPLYFGACSQRGGIEVYESAINQRAYCQQREKLIVMDPTKWDSYGLVSGTEYYRSTFLHELGHALGYLQDEYDKTDEVGELAKDAKYRAWWASRNCAESEAVKASFPAPQNVPSADRNSCSLRTVYRSTVNSMMRFQLEQPKFNVVSCAWILAKIKGGQAKNYFSECEGYATVKK